MLLSRPVPDKSIFVHFSRDDKPSAHNALSYLSPYKFRFEKTSFKKNLSETLSFEHMNLVAENFVFI